MKTLDEMSRELRAEFKALRAEVQELRETMVLPGVMTNKRAAKALSIGLTTLKLMIRRGQISTVAIGNRQMVPASEVRRVSTPKLKVKPGPKPRITRRQVQDSDALRRR